MKLPILAVAGLFLTVAFAGCAGDDGGAGPAGDSSDVPVAPPATNDANTAAIDGVVFDLEERPIKNAVIGIRLSDSLPNAIYEETKSDADGRFTYSFLAPGTYDVIVSRLGFVTKTETVELFANEPPKSLVITLEALKSTEPYKLLKQDRGLFGCGFELRPVIGVAVCGVIHEVPGQNFSQYDRFLIEWPFDGNDRRAVNSSVFELDWESTQPAGQALSMIWEKERCYNVGGARFVSIGGHSPLHAFVETERMQATLGYQANCASGCVDAELKCMVTSRIFPDSETLGPSSPADVGFTFQQPYDIYMSLFFYKPADPEYSQLPS